VILYHFISESVMRGDEPELWKLLDFQIVNLNGDLLGQSRTFLTVLLLS
jgi:hypothetical protein